VSQRGKWATLTDEDQNRHRNLGWLDLFAEISCCMWIMKISFFLAGKYQNSGTGLTKSTRALADLGCFDG
jgi:hypothetical protein